MFSKNWIFVITYWRSAWLQIVVSRSWNSFMVDQARWTVIESTLDAKFSSLILIATVTNDADTFETNQIFESILPQIFQSTLRQLKIHFASRTLWRFMRNDRYFQTFQAKTMETGQYSCILHEFLADVTYSKQSFYRFHRSKKKLLEIPLVDLERREAQQYEERAATE